MSNPLMQQALQVRVLGIIQDYQGLQHPHSLPPRLPAWRRPDPRPGMAQAMPRSLPDRQPLPIPNSTAVNLRSLAVEPDPPRVLATRVAAAAQARPPDQAQALSTPR